MRLGELLRSETVETVGFRRAAGVGPDQPLADAVACMRREQCGAVLVCDGTRLAGLLTERDVLKRLGGGDAKLSDPIRLCMATNLVTAQPDELIASVVDKMQSGGFRRLPVVDRDGQPLGLISVHHVLKFIADCFPGAVFNLPPRPGEYVQEREGA